MTKTLEERVAELEARLPPSPSSQSQSQPPPPPPEPTAEERRGELEARIEGQRESVRIAEEGQAWVDAIALEVGGKVAEHDAIYQEERRVYEELGLNAPPVEKETASRRRRAALADLEHAGLEHRRAAEAAEAHRVATVESARARLAGYEADLAALK